MVRDARPGADLEHMSIDGRRTIFNARDADRYPSDASVAAQEIVSRQAALVAAPSATRQAEAMMAGNRLLSAPIRHARRQAKLSQTQPGEYHVIAAFRLGVTKRQVLCRASAPVVA